MMANNIDDQCCSSQDMFNEHGQDLEQEADNNQEQELERKTGLNYTSQPVGAAGILKLEVGNDCQEIIKGYFNELSFRNVYVDYEGKIAGVRCSICGICGEFKAAADICPCWWHRPSPNHPYGEFYDLLIDCEDCQTGQSGGGKCYRVQALTECKRCYRSLPFAQDQRYETKEDMPSRTCYLCSLPRIPAEILADLSAPTRYPWREVKLVKSWLSPSSSDITSTSSESSESKGESEDDEDNNESLPPLPRPRDEQQHAEHRNTVSLQRLYRDAKIKRQAAKTTQL
jgi:hypothetical protein